MINRFYRTNCYELVRSKYERAVANFLFSHGIRYIYEKRYQLNSNGTFIVPDFYLPDYDIYIEIWGFVGKRAYNKRMWWKKHHYKKDGVQLIELFPRGGRLNYQYFIKKQFELITGERFPAKKRIPYFSPDLFPLWYYPISY